MIYIEDIVGNMLNRDPGGSPKEYAVGNAVADLYALMGQRVSVTVYSDDDGYYDIEVYRDPAG